MTRKSLLWFLRISMICLVLASFSSCGKEEKASLTLLQANVNAAEIKSKQKVIDAAGSAFALENNRNPESLEELVEAGYLDEKAIVDKNGNPLPFDPESLTFNVGGSSTTLISKSCGACGQQVSNSSAVGDTCPHCGVRWGYETTTYANAN
jgi:competence protein ComGC